MPRKTDLTLLAARFGTYPASVFVACAGWVLFDVLVLGNWAPKFGQGGTIQVGLLLAGALSFFALLASDPVPG